MEVFFEAWVESTAETASRRVGARLRSGRRQETRVPLDWQPTSAGSQRSLLPDVVLERGDVVVVLDAKYKRHAEQIERLGWSNASDELREQHRNDVLQALAYSTLFTAPRVVACLIYPAALETWRAMAEHRRVATRATVRSGARHVELALLAVPLSGNREEVAGAIEELVTRGAKESGRPCQTASPAAFATSASRPNRLLWRLHARHPTTRAASCDAGPRRSRPRCSTRSRPFRPSARLELPRAGAAPSRSPNPPPSRSPSPDRRPRDRSSTSPALALGHQCLSR